jgi:hypothetical protein
MSQPRKRTRFISQVLYRLKRRFGAKITFIRDSASLDLETGKKTTTKATWDIRRVIVLPNSLNQQFVYDLAYIAGNKNFTEGAIFDTGQRKLILDAKDIGTYVPQMRDYFTYDNERWHVIKVQKFELNTGYMITGQIVEGSPARDVHNENARNRCIFSQTASVEVL